MKDSAVSPVMLFSPTRQRRLLDGLIRRVANSRSEHERLLQTQSDKHQNLEKELAEQLAQVKANCYQDRRSTLEQWDKAQEDAISSYEFATVEIRDHLRRVRTKYRRLLTTQEETINNKVEKRISAVNNQYNARKDQPKTQCQADFQLLDQTLSGSNEDLEWARSLTMRRINRLLDVQTPKDLYAEFQESKPESVRDAVDLIIRQNRKLKSATAEMQTGFASKVVDSFYLPAAVAVFIVIWSIAVLLIKPENLIVWLIGSVPAAGVVGFTIYGILLIPLRKMTRRLHPLTERMRLASEDAVITGKRISKATAKQAAEELITQREAHLAEAKRWQTEQLEIARSENEQARQAEHDKLETELNTIDGQFRTGFAELQSTMRDRAEQIASNISQTLTQTDEEAGQTLNQSRKQHQHTLESLAKRLDLGLRRGMSRIQTANDLINYRFPPWQDILQATPTPHESVDFLPLGHLRLGSRLKTRLDEALGFEPQEDLPEEANILKEIEVSERMPIAIHRRRHCGVIIEAPASRFDEAIGISHQLLWRLLSSAMPGRAKVTLIDPNSRGQHFASFMALADHDPSLIHHRIWTTGEKIAQRLAELAMHVEDVLQSSLRDQFERIEDYNAVAGSLAHPYHAIAAVGFPEGLSRDAHSHLMSLIQSGIRCGIFVVLVVEQGRDWPPDLPKIESDKLLRIRYRGSEEIRKKSEQSTAATQSNDDEGQATTGHWCCDEDELRDWEFWPAPPPPPAIRESLTRRIGRDSLEAARVIVPLQSLLVERDNRDDIEPSTGDAEAATDEELTPESSIPPAPHTGNTDNGISITVGSQGAGRLRNLLLGEGVRQHVLIAGKTGSGKSTLLHSIITAGAAQYRSDQLQFFLLDFKKGVEFKVYAETGLPHARVIGIESEREFGRSVLQRLDSELASRGEAFRDANVQELGEFRSKNPDVLMPRIILVVDEFQELFTRDDSLASDCTALLDRLVRQGRSFGIHIILSSQSLAGANSLPRATLGQMAVRIAMQCSESDAALILADDNTAARLLSRPGEAIYNDASGLLEGNHPFQVAWLDPNDHESMLKAICTRDQDHIDSLGPSIVFEGNRPSRFTAALAKQAISAAGQADTLAGLLGDAVELGPPASLKFQADNGRNAMLVATPKLRVGVVTSVLASAFAHRPNLQVQVIDGARADDGPSIADWVRETNEATDNLLNATIVRNRDAEPKMIELANLISDRLANEADQDTSSDAIEPILVVVDALDRLRDLRQDDSMDFSLDAPMDALSGSKAFQAVLRDGPAVGVFVFVTLSSAETLSRWLPRKSHHDLEMRIVGPINAADSSLLIDSPVAADLSPATMILYDDADGRLSKFRLCDPPTLDQVQQLLAMDLA